MRYEYFNQPQNLYCVTKKESMNHEQQGQDFDWEKLNTFLKPLFENTNNKTFILPVLILGKPIGGRRLKRKRLIKKWIKAYAPRFLTASGH